MKFCAKCGTSTVEGNRFCMGCGAAISVTSPPPAASAGQSAPASAPAEGSAKQCPVCALTYPASQKFCNADGTALVTTAAPTAVPVPEPSASAQAPAEAAPSLAPSAVQPEPVAPIEPVAPVEPVAAIEMPATPATPEIPKVVEVEGLACPKCGLAFPPGVRFCDQDGATLVSRAVAGAAMALASKQPPAAPPIYTAPIAAAEPAWDEGWDDAYEPSRRRPVLIASLVVLAMLAAGGGYLYWNGALDKWIGRAAEPRATALADATDGASDPAVTQAGARSAPGLLGTYKAHLADQDIELVINGESARPLVSSQGTVTYLNVVNGGTCTALLVPVSGGGVGGDTGNAVRFRQTPVPGKPNCPQDIPVRIDITSQPASAEGVVSAIQVEWFSGNPERTLMSGKLDRVLTP